MVFVRSRQYAPQLYYMLPWAHPSPNPKRHLDWIRSAVFARLTAESRYTLPQAATFPLKIAPFHGGIWTPTYYMLPWAHPSPQPGNGISIVSAVFAELATVTDRQTGRDIALLIL